MNWADWLNDIGILRVMDIHWSYQNLLFWAGIVWHRLSANRIVRCFKLEKLKNYMRYQFDFLLLLKLQKISYYFALCWKILLASQGARFFTFHIFDLLILMPGVHCYIVHICLVSSFLTDFSSWSLLSIISNCYSLALFFLRLLPFNYCNFFVNIAVFIAKLIDIIHHSIFTIIFSVVVASCVLMNAFKSV